MIALLIALTILCTAVGNLLLKIGVQKDGIVAIWPFSLINLHTFFGTVSFGLAFLGYATLLRQMPLNLAQSIFSLQFVVVILTSALILQEPISPLRWLGVILIASGIVVVGWTADGRI